MAKSADCLRQTMFFQICWSLVQLPVGVAEVSPGLIAGGVVALLVYLPVSALLLTTLVLSRKNETLFKLCFGKLDFRISTILI